MNTFYSIKQILILGQEIDFNVIYNDLLIFM